jgi:hypothetical protein
LLPASIAAQRFEPIARQDAEFIERHDRIQLIKLPRGNSPKRLLTGRPSPSGGPPVEDVLGSWISERANRVYMIARLSCYCNPSVQIGLTPAIQLQSVAAEPGATQGATRRRRSFVIRNGLLGRCASLVGLQRYVDTDRVPNDGVSGPCYLPNDLTAALANLSKTLREVVDGQTK